MDKIKEIIGTIQLPRAVFVMAPHSDGEDIYFEVAQEEKIIVPETNNELEKLVYNAAAQALSTRMVGEKCRYELDENRITDSVLSNVKDVLIQLWMKVNNKKEFRRTKLYKDMSYARSDKFKKLSIELFLDAARYDITRTTLRNNPEIKPIHKFIATKFQAMVEAECPR